MNCQDVRHQLQPYSDGELDLIRNLEMERHLAECSECAEQHQNLKSLRAAISSPALYHRAPAALRSKIQLSVAPLAPPRRRWSFTKLAMTAAGILLLIGGSVTTGVQLARMGGTPDDRITDQIVAGHVRSLQVEHAIDVASSDRHTVKPWFHGKLDFSPHVPDLSPQGYNLSGGRLDYQVDRPVAALVYYRRLHAINLFTWPAGSDEEKPVRKISRQGFHIRHWQRLGMTYWAISDLNDHELDEFVQFFQEQSPPLAR